MNIFYEDGGSLKVASIVQKNDATYQADTQHGKRVKIKAANAFIEFDGDMEAFLAAAKRSRRNRHRAAVGSRERRRIFRRTRRRRIFW